MTLTIIEGVTGNERTSTVPFMALKLLAEEGEIKHIYAHDAESFIWFLTWICLQFENGELRKSGRRLDPWLKADALGCAEKRSFFFPSFPRIWHLAVMGSIGSLQKGVWMI